jgi:hypothetical protein
MKSSIYPMRQVIVLLALFCLFIMFVKYVEKELLVLSLIMTLK